MTEGRLFAVVGPSGAGKDTIMAALARARPGIHWVRRAITRPAAPGDEPFEPVSTDGFQTRLAQGHFALHWQAHGLHYGVPATLDAVLAEGRDGMVNLSRQVLVQAAARFAGLHVLNITARDEVRAARLAARGRESAEDIARRVTREVPPFEAALKVTHIDNSGPLADSVAACLRAMECEPV